MVQAWSIPQAKRKDSIGGTEKIPGPGQYQVDKVQKIIQIQSPQYSIGQCGHTDLRQSDAPSPGTYKLPNLLGNQGPKYHFGGKTIIDWEEREKQKLPGPASYSPQTFLKKSPAYTIPVQQRCSSAHHKASSLNKSMESPGPGYYDVNKTTLTGPSTAKMGNQNRQDLIFCNESPGPAKYNINQTFLELQKKSPQFSIGNSERLVQDTSRNSSPGVGLYNLNKTMLSSKGGFIAKNSEIEKREQSPGVGAYNVNDYLTAHTKYGTMGRDKRTNSFTSVSPGPMHYQVIGSEKFKLRSTPKFSIGSARRTSLGGSEAPGPQHYKTSESWNTHKGTTIGVRYQNKETNHTPGSQSYQPDYNKIHYKQGAFSSVKSEREGLINLKEKSKIPGPADYKNYEEKKFKTPSFSFGKSNRSGYDINIATPGPGSYQIPPKFADVPKYLMPNKQNA